MEQVLSNPLFGDMLENVKMGDTRWPRSEGWRKFQQIVNGTNIHYVVNVLTGAVDDFKFMN